MRSICNFGYARSRKGGTHFPDVKGLLRYIQYRDNRDDHIPTAAAPTAGWTAGWATATPRSCPAWTR